MYLRNQEFHPRGDSIPSHIAIIPDGGRRWAIENNVTLYQSYSIMADKFYEIFNYLCSYGIKMISVYFSSKDNFKRSVGEIESFCRIQATFLDSRAIEIAREFDIRIIVVGERDFLPEYLVKSIENVESSTALNSGIIFFICINYNALDEIATANARARAHASEVFVNFLDIPFPVDLLIRTGRVKTLSGFLLAQVSSARLFFPDVLFNDLSIIDVKSILLEYADYCIKYGT